MTGYDNLAVGGTILTEQTISANAEAMSHNAILMERSLVPVSIRSIPNNGWEKQEDTERELTMDAEMGPGE